MREHGLYSWRNPWFRWSVVSLLALSTLSILTGVVWLPWVHDDFKAQGLWASICRAAGIPASWSGDSSKPVASVTPSTVFVLERSMAREGRAAAQHRAMHLVSRRAGDHRRADRGGVGVLRGEGARGRRTLLRVAAGAIAASAD
jgi:hypothetical protein